MILAFDTSCYTSSVALMSADGILLSDKRRVLDVPPKQRGLLQSEALFQHIHNVPAFLEELADEYDFSQITAVGCSVKPRPVEDSYMPVFLGGEKIGRSVAAALGVPFIEGSHQEGHMMAGWYSLGTDPRKIFALPFFRRYFRNSAGGKRKPRSFSADAQIFRQRSSRGAVCRPHRCSDGSSFSLRQASGKAGAGA